MDNLENECTGTANPAEAEDGKKVAADLGKFKDVKALLAAYNSLEAEFTRRSQRLKELEERSKASEQSAPAGNGAPSSAEKPLTADLYAAASGDEQVKGRIIADYLSAVAKGRGAPIVTGGICVPSPAGRPATIKDAGRLAAEFLKNS